MLPTFIIAGAAKSGSTSLWHYLKAHPEVCMASIKETNFFTRETPAGRYDKGLDWYKSQFQQCGGAKAVGEASPAYLHLQDSPRLIHQTLPNVQLIFILRDPVKRVYSNYWYEKQTGAKLPDFESMVLDRHPQLLFYIEISKYNLHLERYQSIFPREQLCVLINEDMQNSPAEFLENTYDLIGVDPKFIPPDLEERFNPAREVRVAWFQRLLNYFGPRIMYLDMPDWLFNFLKRTRKILWTSNTSAFEYPPMPLSIRQDLLTEFSETTEYLENFLGRTLHPWK